MNRTILALALACPFATGRLAAQRMTELPDRQRPGPEVAVGLGVSNASPDCDGCGDLSGAGLALRSSFGWRFSQRVAVAIEVDGHQRTDGSSRYRHILLGGVATVRAWRGLSLRLGSGKSFALHETATTIETNKLKGSATGFLLGATFDLPLSDRVVASPFLDYRKAGVTDLSQGGSSVMPDYKFSTLEFGVSLRWSLRSLLWPNPRDRSPE